MTLERHPKSTNGGDEKLPGAAMSRDKLWNVKVDQISQTPTGYNDPEGEYHSLKLGDSLVVERDLINGVYRVIIKNDKGDLILEEGKLPKLIREENHNEIVSAAKDLPPLKSDFVRLVHLTNPTSAEQIRTNGLDYSRQGMISSTARWWSKAEDCQFRSDDPRFTFPGAVAVVMDVPSQEIRSHNTIGKAPGIIPKEYLVGIVKQE